MNRSKFLFFTVVFLLLFKTTNILAFNEYNAGEKIRFRGNDYYVLENSDSTSDYIYLLKGSPLNSIEMHKYGKDDDGNFLDNELSENVINNDINYYTSDNCKFDDTNFSFLTEDCRNKFDGSIPQKVINNWKKNVFSENELKVVDGYDAKLLSKDDVINKLHYQLKTVNVYNGSYTGYFETDETYNVLPSSILSNINSSWLMSSPDSNEYAYSFPLTESYVFGLHTIVPTIYLKKCVIEGTCVDKTYEEYHSGDRINIHGENYYVIENSDRYTDYITIIKEKGLELFDIKKYGFLSNQMYNKINFTTDLNCKERGFKYYLNYDESEAKTLIDGWANSNFYNGELKNVNGYKARVLDEDDYIFKSNFPNSQISNIINSSTFRTKKVFNSKDECLAYTDSYEVVNPVVNLKKCAINGTCVTTEKDEFKAGDLINYKGETYHVLKDSDKYTNYVTLYKDKPLTKEEMMKYYSDESAYGSDNSVQFSNNNSNSYDKSIVKKIVDGWANDVFGNSLVYEDKYVARILSTDDLVKYLAYEWGTVSAGTSYFYSYRWTYKTPSWFTKAMWLMTPYDDFTDKLWYLDGYSKYTLVGDKKKVHPIINVGKCVLNPDSDNCQKCKRVIKSNIELTKYKEYSMGDVIRYRNNDYVVVDDSNSETSYLKLLKKDPLTAEEINNYGKDDNNNSVINRYTFYSDELLANNIKHGIFGMYNKYYGGDYKTATLCSSLDDFDCNFPDDIPGKRFFNHYLFDLAVPGYAYEYENGYGGMQYFSDESCHLINNLTRNDSNNCGSNEAYDYSNIKVVVDNWAKSELLMDDLMLISDYNYRLIYIMELYYSKYNSNLVIGNNYFSNPDYDYWITNGLIDKDNDPAYSKMKVYGVKKISGPPDEYGVVFQLYYPTIRPIIFLKKSALKNGIYTDIFNVSKCYTKEDDEIIPDPTNDPEDPEIIEEDIKEEDIKEIIEEKKQQEDKSKEEPEIIEVPSTSKIISAFIKISSIILIVVGICIVIKNIFNSKVNIRKK